MERGFVAGNDFVQIKDGPFDVDLLFAPDGINNFAVAKARGLKEGKFSVANLRDIIASKRASGRTKDQIDIPLLESFRAEWEKAHPTMLRAASDVALRRGKEQA